MGKKLATLTLCTFVASVMAGSVAHAGDPTLIGWWKLNDGAGTIALDCSSYGNNGTVMNPNARSGPGRHGLGG